MNSIKYIFLLCLIAGFSACRAPNNVSIINQNTSFPAEEVCEVLSQVLETNDISYLLSHKGELYEIETDWIETKTSLDIILELGNIFSKPEQIRHYTTYTKYFVTVSDSNYSIRGITRNIQTGYQNSIEIPYTESNYDVANVIPDSELWTDMTFLVSQINNGLGVDPYRFEIKQVTWYDNSNPLIELSKN